MIPAACATIPTYTASYPRFSVMLASRPPLTRGSMSAKMTRERAEKFGAAWNSGNADLVTSFFAEDGAYHASVGPDHLGKSYFGKREYPSRGTGFFRPVS